MSSYFVFHHVGNSVEITTNLSCYRKCLTINFNKFRCIKTTMENISDMSMAMLLWTDFSITLYNCNIPFKTTYTQFTEQ
jgi:hypothetical protein